MLEGDDVGVMLPDCSALAVCEIIDLVFEVVVATRNMAVKTANAVKSYLRDNQMMPVLRIHIRNMENDLSVLSQKGKRVAIIVPVII